MDENMLNSKQRLALNAMKEGCNVHLYGEAGTGKSFVTRTFLGGLSDEERKKTIIVAPTGIAAINIDGVTIHRAFKAPIGPIPPQLTEKQRDSARSLLENITCVILDEVSMCRRDLFEYLSNCICACDHKLQLIVIGDFLQLPPVTTDEDLRALNELYKDGFNAYPFTSKAWDSFGFVDIKLDEIVRQSGSGEIEFVTNLNKARIDDKSCLKWFEEHSCKEVKKDTLHICARNREATNINKEAMRKFNEDEIVSFSAKETGKVTPADKVVPDLIELAPGARVISVLNGEGYQNGSLGVVQTTNPLIVKFDNGISAEITAHDWDVCNYTVVKTKKGKEVKKEVIGTYTQIPLRLGYAITIHKSQGQTYDDVVVHPSCFLAGQLYTALSRCKTIHGLTLQGELKPEYLIASKEAIDFYAKIENVTKSKSQQGDIDFYKKIENVTKSKSKGGKREGAGRKPKYKGPTKVMRVPISLVPEIEALISSLD
ncbi:MAG: AAA family ATPase [Eubacterium sp.]|nr:AAA family ATPase [Eubacterium sp.]